MTGYTLKSDIPEKLVEWWVSQYVMGLDLPDVPDEQETGADMKIADSLKCVTIYMQFKKSYGLKTVDSYPKGRENKIRKFRFERKFIEDKILYFQLRDKAQKKALDFQHNILKAHHNPIKYQYAIYVAPLHLNKEEYKKSRSLSPFPYPFYWGLPSVYFLQNSAHDIPFLKEHVSIVPHEEVSDYKHYYAYSDKGENITWHSPSIVEQQEPSNLNDFLKYVFTESIDKNEKLTLSELARNVQLIGKEYSFEYKSESPIKILREYDKWLYNNYEIKQFIFVSNDNFQNLGFVPLSLYLL